ncbi:cobalt transport family protein [Mycobacterium xenopi 4042]|uniref:Cobalt transport family protein n=1 Tax=Mycobacterium xenopi 4042 TaxID=1299334 RepID=X8ARK1_MYCXE|nr:cobalt transport family protein [Mycobacterium xenopi 4042]
MTAATSAQRTTRRPPGRWCCCARAGSSPVHELWAGTKLLVVFAISVLLTFYPGWVSIGFVAATVLLAARIAHIPRGCCRRCRCGCGS